MTAPTADPLARPPDHPPHAACDECGNDAPTEGYRLCLDCLEATEGDTTDEPE